jgi:hypothetical protein
MTDFTEHATGPAPPAMTAIAAKQGYLPVGVALLAESPGAPEGFLRLSAAVEACALGGDNSVSPGTLRRWPCRATVASGDSCEKRQDAPTTRTTPEDLGWAVAP